MNKKIIGFFGILFLISFIIFNYKLFLSSYYNNNANNLYINKDYSGALLSYNKSISYNKNNINLHNLGNSYFKLSDKVNKELLNNSLEAYSGSLSIKYTDETKYNYNLVLDLLQEENKEKDNGESDNSEDNNGESTEDNNSGDNQNTVMKNGEYQELKQLKEQIIAGEETYSDYFNKQQDTKDVFLRDFFDNGGEKDW